MALKLNKNVRPDDLTAKVPLRLFKDGDVLKDKAGVEGFIELWADDAAVIKPALSRITGRFTTLQAIRARRSEADWRALSDDFVANENEEWRTLSSEALAVRTKAWHLIDTDGDHVDVPVSIEAARELFGDTDHELREVALSWLADNPSAFFPKTNKS